MSEVMHICLIAKYIIKCRSHRSEAVSTSKTFAGALEGGGRGGGGGGPRETGRLMVSPRARQHPGYTYFVDLTWRSESDQSNGSSLARYEKNSKDVGSFVFTTLAEEEDHPPLYGELGPGHPRTSTVLHGEPGSDKELKNSDGGDDCSCELERSAHVGSDPPLYVLPTDHILPHDSRCSPVTLATEGAMTDDSVDMWLHGRTGNGEGKNNSSKSLCETCAEGGGGARLVSVERDTSPASRYRGLRPPNYTYTYTPNNRVSRAWPAGRGVRA